MTPIVLGNGDESKRAVALLHAKLDEALKCLGGLQQPPHWDHEPTTAELQQEAALDAEARRTIQGILTELATALGEPFMLLDSLAKLVEVPGRYNPANRNKVRMELTHDDKRGWTLSRDDAAGGGPYRNGPYSLSPSGAVSGFMKMVEEGKQWSALR